MKYIKILGFILLSIISILYSYTTPETISKQEKIEYYITLEGAFKTNGSYKIDKGILMKDLIKKVGVKDNASLESLNMNITVLPESRYYLPTKKSSMISLNKATLEDFMTLNGVGEKTASKIIDYRQNHVFTTLEDIMNIEGIGEKKYLKYRDYLCL